MQEPFDIDLNGVVYSVFPEEDDTFTIFREGEEYMRIKKDTEEQWLRLDDETDLPLFTEETEVNQLGREIVKYTS